MKRKKEKGANFANPPSEESACWQASMARGA